MLTGFNHLTLSVKHLHSSITFYRNVLGLQVDATWDKGAYLSLPGLWLCLSLEPDRDIAPRSDYTHYAFSIAEHDLPAFTSRLIAAGVKQWKENTSEGSSYYFLDPDGHKLELHAGDLQSRLDACRQRPYQGMTFFNAG